MNMLHPQYSSYEELIEDHLSRAFAMCLGTKLPEKESLTFLIDCVKVAADASGEEITEQYVRDYIPIYIDKLYKQNY